MAEISNFEWPLFFGNTNPHGNQLHREQLANAFYNACLPAFSLADKNHCCCMMLPCLPYGGLFQPLEKGSKWAIPSRCLTAITISALAFAMNDQRNHRNNRPSEKASSLLERYKHELLDMSCSVLFIGAVGSATLLVRGLCGEPQSTVYVAGLDAVALTCTVALAWLLGLQKHPPA